AVAGAKTDSQKGAAISASIAYTDFDNDARAIVQSGAQLNQTTSFQTNSQSVQVSATTTMKHIDMVGIGKWSLNQSPFAKAGDAVAKDTTGKVTRGGELKKALSGGGFIDFYSRGGQLGVGGSVLVAVMNNTTLARIEPKSSVRVGPDGKLTL